MSLLESTILIIVFTLIGLPSLSNAGSLYFECLKGKEWKIEKSQSTWFGIFSLFLAVIGYSLISGLITVSLIISVAYIISKDY